MRSGVTSEVAVSRKVKDLRVGETAVITGYEGGGGSYRSRLLAMGLTRGTPIKLLKVAPLGDPVQIEVRDFSLSLRKHEADVLLVEAQQERPPETQGDGCHA